MRIVIDLDGTISELKKQGQTYTDVRVNPHAVKRIKELKKAGHYIILQTARHMKTCDANQGKVIARIGKETLDWLARQKVPYDEIHFGKPYADAYIDDLAVPFTGWDKLDKDYFDTEMNNILIPIAGKGSRFKSAGYKKPKPLIDVQGKTMIEWAVKSFEFIKDKKYKLIFVVHKDHLKYKLDEKLKNLFGEKTIVVIQDAPLQGQADSCLYAKEYINNFNRLFIFNCDTYSTSNIQEIINMEDPDGILECFKAKDPRYSYAKLDKYGYVTETAEKRVISNNASTGMYYFKRGLDFVRSAERMIKEDMKVNNEFYIIPCYNVLLGSGKRVRIAKTKENWVMGTPEELDYFNTYHESSKNNK